MSNAKTAALLAGALLAEMPELTVAVETSKHELLSHFSPSFVDAAAKDEAPSSKLDVNTQSAVFEDADHDLIEDLSVSADLAESDEVVFIGASGGELIEPVDVAKRRKTITNEVSTSFTNRLARVYTRAGLPVAVVTLIEATP